MTLPMFCAFFFFFFSREKGASTTCGPVEGLLFSENGCTTIIKNQTFVQN